MNQQKPGIIQFLCQSILPLGIIPRILLFDSVAQFAILLMLHYIAQVLLLVQKYVIFGMNQMKKQRADTVLVLLCFLTLPSKSPDIFSRQVCIVTKSTHHICHVFSSVCMYRYSIHWMDFLEIAVLGTSMKICQESSNLVKTGYWALYIKHKYILLLPVTLEHHKSSRFD